MKCVEVREMLPAYAEGGGATLSVRRHLARCADCKAALAQYDELAASLRDLRAATVEPPAALVTALKQIPDGTTTLDEVFTHVVRNRRAYVGGLAVALAGAAGAALWHRRRVATA